MGRRRLARTRRVLAALSFAALALVALPVASASPTLHVYLVVHEQGVGGIVTATNIPGCAAGDVVDDVSNSVQNLGNTLVFTGTKLVHCATGTFSFAYASVTLSSCSAQGDRGLWWVIGGTGSFAGVRGLGTQRGTYTGGTLCTSTGIDDTWTGTLGIP